ncbi:hypothetical protein AGLY_005244 [Aphis glycines]|uniref:Gustatory receptor n=1 Tax=Aphis glycines TaxID=307491 RepID=A0A6G0TW90_APHGL|nr:hypothetical protein AGLY_005244 [Aphis glycines]
MEKTRLLHSGLCELLKNFTTEFGPLFLAFFISSFSCLLIGIFCMVTHFHILDSATEAWDQLIIKLYDIYISIFSILKCTIQFMNNLQSFSYLDLISVLFITVIEMTTVFHRTLRPILFLSKCIGLIDSTYTMESTGLLVHNVKPLCHMCFEITRFIILLIFSYKYFYQFGSKIHIIQVFTILKFWINIIAARLLNDWIIKFINGMIEFDRKLAPISTKLLSKQRSFSKRQWDIFLISFFLYFIVYKFLHFVLSPVKTVNIFTLTFVLFAPPFILDYVITSSLCYFLHNLHARFLTVNDLWKCLPAELVVDYNQWTHIEVVLFMEKMRLLHSELCELLRKFTIGFGPLLLTFFTFSFSCLLIGVFSMVTRFHILFSAQRSAAEVRNQIINITDHIQIVIFMMSIIVYVSLIEEQRTKIISYLRSYKISNLHMDVKKQLFVFIYRLYNVIKMFMNQMSFSGLDQITAFGFFNVNLNLVMSILVLIITGITTFIQIKHDPITMKLQNNTFSYLDSLFLNFEKLIFYKLDKACFCSDLFLIKMFMNQMSLSGLDQITAFGFFDVNLNLVTSISTFRLCSFFIL